MVRTMPSNPWRCADFLERVRPGLPVSAALHIGLFIVFAYLLAFHSPMPTQETTEQVLTVIDLPKPSPPQVVEVPKVSIFKPLETRTIASVHTTMQPFVLPLTDDTNTEPAKTVTSTEPQPLVIKDPTPVYRGSVTYPNRAADANREGYVDFAFIIEPDGTVGSPRVVAEVPEGYGFASAAMKAFPHWKFNPMTRDGHPIAAPASIRISFKLK